MNRFFLAGFLVLGCIAGLALDRGQSGEEAATSPTPTILVGGCSDAPNSINTPYVVFGLGNPEYGSPTGGDYGCNVVGPPLHGVPMPSAGTLQNLRVTGGAIKGATPGSSATVYVNGTATALTCTVSTSGTCADAIHKVTVKAGNEVAATYSSGDGSMDMIMSFEKR